MMSRRVLLLVALSVALVGCGGSGSSSSPVGTPTGGAFGDARVQMDGNPKPLELSYESGLTTTGIAGTSISSLTIYPQKNDNNAPIYYVVNGIPYFYQRGNSQLVLDPNAEQVVAMDVANNGQIFAIVIDSAFDWNLVRWNSDGSGFTVLASNVYLTAPPNQLRVSPDGSKIVYEANNSLYIVSTSGGTPALLDDQDTCKGGACFTADGKTIVFCLLNKTNYVQLALIPVAGGNSTPLSQDALNHYLPCVSPDGLFAYCDTDNGVSRWIASYSFISGTVYGTNYFPAVPYASGVRFSPDGRHMTATVASTYGGATQVAVQDLSGVNFSTLAAGTVAIWSPLPAPREFVGTTSWMYPSATGFLYTQFQPGFASLVTFTATTPADATITNVSGTGSTGPAVYDLHADRVTGVKITNAYFGPITAYTPNTSDVLISLDTNSGAITTVAPYVRAKGAALTKAFGAGLQYRAHFTAVYDRKGKNVAPSGASSLSLDAKTGAVIGTHV